MDGNGGNNAPEDEQEHTEGFCLRVQKRSTTCQDKATGTNLLGISYPSQRSIPHMNLRQECGGGGILGRLLTSNGWCPNQVIMSLSCFGPDTTNFSGLLTRRHLRTHLLCTDDSCVSYRVAKMGDIPRHVNAGCSCFHLKMSMEKIERLILRGAIPLLSITITAMGVVRLKVMEWTPGVKFIALSHVWSNGLGNARINSLPACQLQRIFHFVSNILAPPHLFWLDTLCLPREPMELRRRGIENIRSIYEKACITLVLDEELLVTPGTGISDEQALIRINLSSWSRRVWTLHEAVCCQRLGFQFADSVYEPYKAIENLFNIVRKKQSDDSILQSNLLRAMTVFGRIMCLRKHPSEAVRLDLLWDLLRWRILTWPEDETICMANMLGVDREQVDMLLETPNDQRMVQFLQLFSKFPTRLLFLQGPKIDIPTFRWAPQSWLHSQDLFNERHRYVPRPLSIAVRVDHGLLLKCHFTRISLNIPVGINTHSGLLELSVRHSDQKYFLRNARDTDAIDPLIICLEDPLENLNAYPDSFIRGVLVRQESLDLYGAEEIYFGSVLCSLWIASQARHQKNSHTSQQFTVLAGLRSAMGTFCLG